MIVDIDEYAEGAILLDGLESAIGTVVAIVGEVATGIITTVYAVQNEQQRLRLLDQVQYLDEKQATELETNLRKSQSANDRLAYAMDFLSKVEGEKLAKKIKGEIENKNLGGVMSERKKIIMVFGGIIALLFGIVIIKKITK